MNFPRLTAAMLATIALGGLGSCSTDDVDCFDACIPEPLIIDFQTGTTNGTRYVEGDLQQTFENGAWRITGNAGNGAAFGIRFSCLSNALYYDEIRLSIRSDAAPVRLAWELQSAGNEPGNGQCTAHGWCESETCTHSTNNINLNPSFAVARTFGVFTNGEPDANPFGGELIGMRWRIPDDAGEIDLVVSELSFVRTAPISED